MRSQYCRRVYNSKHIFCWQRHFHSCAVDGAHRVCVVTYKIENIKQYGRITVNAETNILYHVEWGCIQTGSNKIHKIKRH